MPITTPITAEQQLRPSNQQKNGNGRVPFSQLLEQFDFPQPKRGDTLQGEILRIDEDVLYVDVGSKRDAMVPFAEVSRLDESVLDNLSRGDEVPVYVTRTPVGDENLLVSLERGLQQLDWERARECQDEDETLELKVIKQNKGGLAVKFGAIQGFVPNSHVPELRKIHDQQERQRFKAKQIGTTRPLKIIEVNPKKERLVFSATAVAAEAQKARMQALTEGETVTGEVVSLKKYGAFVDIGAGLTGLLHISKIAWEHLNHPADVLTVGEEIDVIIDNIEIERERISLNRKALLPGPWEEFADSFETGDLVEGEVTAVVDFGAFVKLSAGVEGLLHKNEMHLPPEGAPADVLQSGDEVLVRIISIELARQRLGLSMRRVSAAEEMEWMSSKSEEEVEEEVNEEAVHEHETV